MSLDLSRLNPDQAYMVAGGVLIDIYRRLDFLTGGEHIEAGPGIYIRRDGVAGFSIRSKPAAVINPPGSSGTRSLFASDASSGATARVQFTPGVYNSVVPTANGYPINAQIGMPLAWPTLTLAGTETLLYAQLDYNSSNVVTSVELLASTALPSATIVQGVAGSDYWGLSTIAIAFAPVTGKASVQCLNDYIAGSQGYTQCGTGSNCWLK